MLFFFFSLCYGKKLVQSTVATEQPDLPLQELVHWGCPEDGEEEGQEEEEVGEKEEVCVTLMPTSRLLKATESSLTNCIHPAAVTEADLTNLRLKLDLLLLGFFF